MASQNEEMHGGLLCAVEVSPETVDAGAGMMLHAEVSSSPPCDLRGHELVIKDQSGTEAGVIAWTQGLQIDEIRCDHIGT